uniref:Disease resistance protein RGA3 n=1 Tax=Nelumbo nucifera TaxID=4432 RepID=A0A822YLT5_NELNU|nr:TPA_asm: hypothetical protein HUJ06_011110 [Nelumbo nucifera]
MATVADVVVSPLVQALLHKLDSSAINDFAKQWNTEKELKQCSVVLQLIYTMVSSIEDMQIRDPCLPIDLADLRETIFRATATLDEFIYEMHHQRIRGKVGQFIHYSFNENQKLRKDEIRGVVADLENELVKIKEKIESKYLNLISSDKWSPDETKRRLQIVSSLDKRTKSGSTVDYSQIFGRKEVAKNLINMLLSEKYDKKKVTVISIVGIGGMGKTTLAQLIYNDQEVVKHFQVRAWVCVSEESDVINITRAVLESITSEKVDMEQLQPLQDRLKSSLEGKRFLLVLDDIWSDDHKTWDDIRISLNVAALNGSRIIVTTRFRRVSSIMSAIETIDLEGLPYENCWDLFKRKAFINDDCEAYPNLKRIGEKIVKKCKGLPLAIKTLGGLLWGESDVNKWNSILESEMWEIAGEDSILPALRLNYYHLPAHLKLCFAYCSLFPKDSKFDKETLVRLWMAEGFVASKQTEIMEDLGGRYFDELLNRSFFQRYYENTFVMHDLIHDLAEFVSKDLCQRVENGKSKIISEKACYISTVDVQFKSIEKEIDKCKGLSTLLLIKNGANENIWYIPNDLFEHRCLRVLDLGGNYSFDSLPDSIGKLKHLRLLNLNWTGIKVLPESLCNLYNLQTLMLKGCELHDFPKDMGSLINLQHIVMDNKYIWKKFTKRGIGRLRFLKTLHYFDVRMINDNSSTITELKELCHLQGKVHIRGLENVANFDEAKEANLISKRGIDQLWLEWGSNGDGNGTSAILEALQPYTGLRHLTIDGYGGLSFPTWMRAESIIWYDMLTILKLYQCNKWKFLPPFGNLASLKELYICNMHRVQYLREEFYGYNGQDDNNGFRKLEILGLQNMHGLKEWWGAEEGEFPRLRQLSIQNCPGLTKLPPLLPTVKQVEMMLCHMLTSLPSLPTASRLTLADCDERILSWMHQCSSLSKLKIGKFKNMASLPSMMLQPLAQTLQTLSIYDCPKLESLPELQDLAPLQKLLINGCRDLASLPKGLNKLTSFQELDIEWTDKMILQVTAEEGGGLSDLASLLKLVIRASPNLTPLPKGLHKLTSLQELTIHWSSAYTKLVFEDVLPTSLQSLIIKNCPKEIMNQLDERGEGYRKIAHIPTVNFEEQKDPIFFESEKAPMFDYYSRPDLLVDYIFS